MSASATSDVTNGTTYAPVSTKMEPMEIEDAKKEDQGPNHLLLCWQISFNTQYINRVSSFSRCLNGTFP